MFRREQAGPVALSQRLCRARQSRMVCVLIAIPTHVINSVAMSNLSTRAQISPDSGHYVSPTGGGPPSLPPEIKQLIGFAKSNPGKLSYGSAGPQHHESYGWSCSEARGTSRHRSVPYKGAGRVYRTLFRAYSMLQAAITQRLAVSQGGTHTHACGMRRKAPSGHPTSRPSAVRNAEMSSIHSTRYSRRRARQKPSWIICPRDTQSHGDRSSRFLRNAVQSRDGLDSGQNAAVSQE